MSASSGPRWIPVALGGVIALLLVALFHFHGVTDLGYGKTMLTRSLFVWLQQRWVIYTADQNDFPYGWAAPLVSLAMVWHLRHELAAVDKRPCLAGLALVLFGLLLHWAGARAQQSRISMAAFMLLVWAIPFYLYGWPVARRLLVPAGFLLFALQFDFLFLLVARLRATVAFVSTLLINGLGASAVRTDPTSLQAGGHVIALAQQPGGLRSIMLVTAAAIMLAWWRQRGLWRQLALVAAAPLLVMAGSVVRTVAHGLGGPMMGHAAVLYTTAFLLLWLLHRALAGLPPLPTGRGVP